jgi:hypothetical protein
VVCVSGWGEGIEGGWEAVKIVGLLVSFKDLVELTFVTTIC